MLYEKEREIARLSLERWLKDEIFSLGWFIEIGILIVVYVIWLKLLDKRRSTELLLIGSLTAVVKSINAMMLGGGLGLFDYSIRLTPVLSNVFVTSVTISPVIVMLSEQYSSSWGGFMLRSAIGFAILNFAIFPLYVRLGALNFYNWNVFYHFLVLFGYSLIVRLAFLWIEGIKKRHLSVKENKA